MKSPKPGDRGPALDGKFDERELRRRWFFGSRVGPDGGFPGGIAEWALLGSQERAMLAGPPAPPGPHGSVNWVPLGPSVVSQGQAAGRPAVSGRITGLAVGPDGLRVYAGAANGGIWFSHDGGETWSPLDEYVVSPNLVPGVESNALSVGGLAVRFGLGAAVDEIYVGTGEPGAADGYFGIGIRHSPTGGAAGTWTLEATNLAGSNIYRVAIDPDDPSRVFAATGKGLYVRPEGGDPKAWVMVDGGVNNFPHGTGQATDVIVAGRGANRRYYVAFPADGVFVSPDGAQWTPVPGAPASVSRTVLASSQSDPSVVYALTDGGSLYRLAGGSFQPVAGVPGALFAGGQGSYDLILGVDPTDADIVYLGGDYTIDQPTPADPADYNLALFRGRLTPGAGGLYTFPFDPANDLDPQPPPRTDPSWRVPRDATWVGRGIHPDVHAFAFAMTHDGSALDGNSVWIGCDGGVFQSSKAGALGSWEPKNLGLAVIEATYLAQHPLTDAVLFSGCQDNGTIRRLGGPAWNETYEGDGGGVAIDPNGPSRVMRQYHNTTLLRCADGGESGDWAPLNFPPRTAFPPAQAAADQAEIDLQKMAAAAESKATAFYAPIAAVPGGAQATLAAFGTNRLWLSRDWGDHWITLPTGTNPYDPMQRVVGQGINNQDTIDGWPVSAIAFATAARLFVATAGGPDPNQPSGWARSSVWRMDEGPAGWSRTRIDLSALPPITSITALAVDDPAIGSFYAALGLGQTDHVRYYDGSVWRGTGLTAATVDVPAHAVAVDPAHPGNVYVGTDLGCWKGTKTGSSAWTWASFSPGLPEAAITDLAVHGPTRLLRAGTYGRGIWEITLDEPANPDPDLFLRVNPADSGRIRGGVRPAWLDGIDDPTGSGLKLTRAMSPDIKIRRGSVAGLPAIVDQPDFFEFATRIGEQTAGGMMLADASGPNAVFVQVHNRGVTPLPGALVRILLLLADSPLDQPPPLPADLAIRLSSGDTGAWTTGTAWTFADRMIPYRSLPGPLGPRTPQICSYTVDFSRLGLPAGHDRVICAAFVTTVNATDRFNATGTDLARLTMHDKRIAYRTIKLVGP